MADQAPTPNQAPTPAPQTPKAPQTTPVQAPAPTPPPQPSPVPPTEPTAPTSGASVSFVVGALVLVALLLGGAYFLWQGYAPELTQEEESLSPEEKLLLLEQFEVEGPSAEEKTQTLEGMGTSTPGLSAEQKAEALNVPQQ